MTQRGYLYYNGYRCRTSSKLLTASRLTETARLRFNVDAFNVLNVPGLNNPDATTGILNLQNSFNSPRALQLTLRLTW